MIYTVTFNPSLDYIISVDNFISGTINRTKRERIFPGGKGINVSIVLKNLGFENTAIGFCAGFTGENIETLLEDMGVVSDFIKVEGGMSRINVKLSSLQDDEREETEINGQGPVITTSQIQELMEQLKLLTKGDVLFLSGSIPPSVPKNIYKQMMEVLENRQVLVAVDLIQGYLTSIRMNCCRNT